MVSGKVPRANATTATRLVTLPVTAEVDVPLDLVLLEIEETVTVEITTEETATEAVVPDLALTREETDTLETIGIEETITETTIERTDVITVALADPPKTAEEVETETGTEETVKIENALLLLPKDLRSARENSALPAEKETTASTDRNVLREEDPTQLATRERKDKDVSIKDLFNIN
jgi:hypothetical protein